MSGALRVAVAGASGRMGRMLVEAVHQAPDCTLAGALAHAGNPSIGQDATAWLGHASGVTVTDDLANGLGRGAGQAQVLIDFTRPEGTLEHLAVCRTRGIAMVIGTTGFTEAQRAEIAHAAQGIGIVMAPNMSVGVNVVLRLLELAARALNEGFDIEIVEAHHRHKVDAPSGTALAMGDAVAQALGRDLKACAVYGREGVTGEREPSTIGFATVRGGDIIGDHTVLFAGTGERIEISHKATSRAVFAQGSLRAARFLAGRRPGLYTMADVLGMGAR